MAAFNWDEVKSDWRSYDLFRHTPVKLFLRDAILDESIQHLENHNYFVFQVDCRHSESESDLYNSILFALGVLQAEYKNISPIQFWDLVTETDFADKKGIVLVFRHFDNVHSRFPKATQHALSVLAGYQYRWLWFGNRFTTFVQTDNSSLELDTIIEVKASWNDRESLLKDRGL